jgi:predicted phosphodiesterase
VKIGIFSDIHKGVGATKPITIRPDVDVVAVAGDINEGAENSFVTLRAIVPVVIPIVFTMGNHEYYRRFLGEELEFAKAIAPNFNIRVLENDTTVIGGVRFAGASLWTDYRLFGDHNAAGAMHAARSGMNDHRLISWKRDPWQRFRPQEALMLHARSRAFFAEIAATPFDGVATVFLSHHAPDFRSVAPRYASDILSAAFASNMLGELLGEATKRELIIANPDIDRANSDPAQSRPRIDLWIHGHVHNCVDYRVGGTRVICNPHGYGNENPAFNPSLTVEVGS